MHIKRNHYTVRAEAIRRIEAMLEDLSHRPMPAGVKIKHLTRNWSGGGMRFDIRAGKSVFSAKISGTVAVSDDSVTLDCKLPDIVTLFAAEAKIAECVNGILDNLFPQPPVSVAGR